MLKIRSIWNWGRLLKIDVKDWTAAKRRWGVNTTYYRLYVFIKSKNPRGVFWGILEIPHQKFILILKSWPFLQNVKMKLWKVNVMRKIVWMSQLRMNCNGIICINHIINSIKRMLSVLKQRIKIIMVNKSNDFK